MLKYLFPLLLFLTACATTPKPPKRESYTSSICKSVYEKSRQTNDSEEQLDLISSLFEDSCFQETIQLGSFVRQKSHDKIYDVSAETFEIMTPEGTFTDYVMESYERTYLSLLLSISYIHLGDNANAMIELRRSQQEAQALLYNYGEDNVLRLLQAALWDRFDPLTARSYWQSLRDNSRATPSIQHFAEARIAVIDQHPSTKVFWRILGFGNLPQLKWHAYFLGSKSFDIYVVDPFPSSCSGESSVLMSTESWANKLTHRYDASYHPLLLAKSFARLPAEMSYGVIGYSTGLAIGFGGCVLDQYGVTNVCKAALSATDYIWAKTTKTVVATVKPDLRHWQSLPSSFYLTTDPQGESKDKCLQDPDLQSAIQVRLIQ